MASETLEEKKSAGEAPVKDKDASIVEQPLDSNKEEEQENKEAPDKEVNEDKDNQDTKMKDAEDKHESEDKDELKEEKKDDEEEDYKDDVAKEMEEDVEGEEEHQEEDEEEDEDEVVETSKISKGGGRSNSSRKRKASSEKKQTEPVTPSSERPTRERKMVERYSAPEPGRSVAKPLAIQKGSGTQLKDIPNVAFKLSKRKPDDNLQMLHLILFGKKAKVHNLKKNIGQFSGYVWAENEEKQKTKIRDKFDKCVKEKLVDFCDVLNIPINKAVVKKEELTVKLLDFLESPHATTDVLLADKEQKGKKRKVSSGKNISPGEDSATPAKKRKRTPQSGEKRKRSSKVDEDEDKIDSPDSKDAKDDESQDDESDVQKEESDQEDSKSEEDEDEPKEPPSTQKASKKSSKETSVTKNKEKVTPAKKGSAKSVKAPAQSAKKSSDSLSKKDADSNSKSKGSASKKQKIEKESPKEQATPPSKDKGADKKQSSKVPAKASAKDQGKTKSSKKAKAEPSRAEMHAVVVDILKEVDFNTATLSDILRQLGTHFGADLMHRKAEVKDIITEVINNMSDEEEDDGEEVEDNADKDGEDE